LNQLFHILQDFVDLFIPSRCINCGTNLFKSEQHVCRECLSKIPMTNFIKNKDNAVSQIFWGRAKLEYAFSYYFFTKNGSLQNLIHEIKYHGAKELAFEMGRKFGNDLKQESFSKEFDVICPVPLHKQKEKLRGYNQSEWLASGLSDALKIPYNKSLLKRKVFTSTQTKKNRQQRWENVKDAFEVDEISKVANKHILLLDDVLTTGATLEACAQKLLEIEGTTVSVASLAYAYDL
jgi:ComF family protein